MLRSLLIASAACALLSGCVSVSSNTFNPTASEQLLTSHASERVASVLDPRLPRGTRVYVDSSFVEDNAVDRYAIAAVRAHLLGHGLSLQDDKTHADVIVELRVAAASLNDVKRFVGVPSLAIPSISATGLGAVTTPEITVYQKTQRTGVVEVALTARSTLTGKLVTAVGPAFAVTRIVNHRVLIGIVWGSLTEPPGVEAEVHR